MSTEPTKDQGCRASGVGPRDRAVDDWPAGAGARAPDAYLDVGSLRSPRALLSLRATNPGRP